MRVHVLALGAVVLGAAVAAACGGETEPTIGPPNSLVGVAPPTPQGGSSSSSSSGGSSSGSTSGSSSGSTSGSSSGSTSSSGAGDGGSTGEGGQVTESCTVSWATDVFPLLESTGSGTCGNSICHGGANSPTITDGNAASTYTALTTYNINGKHYVQPNDTNPSDSTIECNLGIQTPVCGVAQMPEAPGTLSSANFTTIDTWVRCGAPQN